MEPFVKYFIGLMLILLGVGQTSAQVAHIVSSESAETLLEKAKEGDARAQFRMGIAYMDGIGVKPNLRKSAKWFTASAVQDYGPAQYRLAQCLTYGIGVGTNLRAAAICYRKAAEKGIADAQYYYGLLLLYGIGIEQNESSALRWIKAAEEQDYLEATFRLGMHYYNELVALDDSLGNILLDSACYYLIKAADRGHEQAITLLTRTNELQYLYANDLLVVYDTSGAFPDDNTFYPPVFLNDEVDVREYLADYVIYPYFAKVFGFGSSEVLLDFYVEEDGHVGNVEVIAPGPLPEFAEEAMRAMLCLPLWSPGYKGNSVTRAKYQLSIPFTRYIDEKVW